MLKKGFVKKAKQSRMLRNSDKIMSVLTNGKVKLHNKGMKITIRRY